MRLPSSVSLALVFFIKLFLIKVFINEIGIYGARDIFVLSSIAQLAFLLQFGKLAKAKNMVLLGKIGAKVLNSVFYTANIIFLSTVVILILATILLASNGYFEIRTDLILLGFAYGYFVLQTQLYLLRAEAAGDKQRSYLTVLSLNVLLLGSFTIPEENQIIKISSMIIANMILFFSMRSKIDIGEFRFINGWRFFKIESVSTTVGLIELPLIAYAVGAEEVIAYLLLSRILYIPVLFYGQVSRFLWSDGIKHMLGLKINVRPKLVNLIYAGIAAVGLMVLALGFEIIVKFVDEGTTEPTQTLIVMFSLWSLVQIANRYFKNHYQGNAVFEKQYKGYMIIGILYHVGLLALVVTSDEIIFFLAAKVTYSFLIFLYNLSFIGNKHVETSDDVSLSSTSKDIIVT